MAVLSSAKSELGNIVDVEEQNEEIENREGIDESSPLKPNTETKEPEEVKKDVKKKLTLRERLKIIKENTTVEPIMACYVMPSVLASLAVQNLNLEKACRVNLNFGDEVCDALNLRQVENYTSYEDEVQRLIAKTQAWKNIIQTAIPVMLILFVGAWSDKTGRRKACILVPIVGEFLSCIGFIVNKYFFYELPVEVTALTEALFPAITGGWFTNFIGVFSYIGDITTKENRTYRVGLVNMFMSLGYPIGSALSGVILSWVGYYGVFLISGSLYLFSLVYGYYFLEEPKRKSEEKSESQTEERKGFFREFFDIDLVIETFRVAFRKGPGNRRLRVALLLCCVFVIFGPMNGEFTIMYLFARYRFSWNEVQYSMWSTYAIITNLIGTYFSITLFTNYMKLDDTLLGIISIASKIIASFAYAFARTDLEIYLAPLLEILNGTSFIAMRSIATKLVDGAEFGKVNSLFGLAEAMTPLLYGPLYSKVYDATLKILPGAVFLLGSFLTLPAVAIFTWLYFEHKKDVSRQSLKTDAEKQQAPQLK
ncbi:lysosomal proton-coupled steroid conjugate and bile acid symporter SLC46A3-like [Anticarsia gemmatalis]|uniref:lysosomal proton-coupled steroid conjugate and bile acid symporter SLC46A3-like n=1 Tax=Anticarsia gemmatalis TaxID=129554 RepID=UPI003F76705D